MAHLKWLAVILCCAASLARTQANPDDHAKAAQREYAAVFSHADQPCEWTDNSSFLQCMNKEIAFTETHLNAFMIATRGVAADKDAAKPPTINAKSALDALNQVDSSWRAYRENACALEYSFGTGTGAAPASAECELSLDRAYMKMLAGFFNLHELA